MSTLNLTPTNFALLSYPHPPPLLPPRSSSHPLFAALTHSYDHIEPFFGIYSKHDLSDTQVYGDDIVVHGSDYAPDGTDNFGYFREFSGLLDSKNMDGNCKDAGSGYGKNEMYPCIYEDLTYGTAITGVSGGVDTDLSIGLLLSRSDEPDVREDIPAEPLTGSLVIEGVSEGDALMVYRFDDVASFVDAKGDYANSKHTYKYPVDVTGLDAAGRFTFTPDDSFTSEGAAIFRAVRV